MSNTYELEKASAFETTIGKVCYPPEFEPPCEAEDTEISEEELIEKFSQIFTPELSVRILEKLFGRIDQVPIRSCFIPEEARVFWQTIVCQAFIMSGGTPLKYIPPEKITFIYNSYLQVTFPQLVIREECRDDYRISWQKYACFAVIQKGEVKATGGTHICTFDKYGLEFSHSYLREDSHTSALESDVGTDKIMNEWTSTCIPEQKRCCPLYLFYSMSPSNAFPHYKLGEKSLEHCFTFSKDIVNHLRMQKFSDGKWEWMKPDLSKLEGLPTDNRLIDPVLYGQFTTNTSHEKTAIYDDNDTYYIDDILWANSDNPITFGGTFVIPLKTNGKLCRAIFGAVENVTATSYNNSFNFTDNPDDPEQGESPIESIFIYYGDVNTSKIGPYDMSHFKSALISKHFKSSEINKGHFAIPFDYEAWKVGTGSGFVPDKAEAKLCCKLRDKRPTDKDCQFNLILRLRVSKKLIINKSDGLLCQ